ncbi:hypothetical protein [Kribbella kalugense]|uniref:Patatin-like phospholipase n=1 Tax=Kribbella kalugense TaxID=2512221 RepID=A0A4R7ZWZ4_9ACTN|nr:hypothetical protein [Kribbella kalugense]TDW22653.1 hypothetical protein EV650_1490 [Kribbella kalugense]
MANLLGPPVGGLDSTTAVAFRYRRRVLWLIGGVGAFVLLAALLRRGDDTWSPAVWVTLLLIAVLLMAILAVMLSAVALLEPPHVPRPQLARLAERLLAQHPIFPVVLRWAALILTALAAAHFGGTASLKGQKKSIVDIELSGSSKAWTDCDCAGPFTAAVRQDFWFIASYVLLLGLLALWAGAYFRLPALRRARTTVVIAIVVAGLLDVVEDVLMLAAGSSNGTWQFVAVCAWGKFALLLAAVVYIAAGAFAWWSTPRWVRLASWALPKYAREAAAEAPTSTPTEEVVPSAAGTQTVRSEPPAEAAKHGIALSGGGIRASSISLGALQALDGGPLDWSKARAVTAVSGGSNMAAGWSISRSSYQTADDKRTAQVDPGELDPWEQSGGNPHRVEPSQLNPVPWQQKNSGWLTAEERHLVDNLGYLASNQPRGSDTDPAAADAGKSADLEGDRAYVKASYRPAFFATIIAGLTVNVVVLLSMLWAITQPMGWALRNLSDQDGNLRQGAIHDLVKQHSLALPGIIFLLVGFAALMLWVLAGRLLVGPAQDHQWARVILQTLKRAAYGGLALGAALALALWAFVELVGAVAYLSLPALIASAAAGAGVIGSVVRILKKPAARFAPMLGGFAFVVVALGLAALATWSAAKQGASWSSDGLFTWQSGWNWVAALAFVTVALLGPSPESWSLAPFYRGKLRLAYASYRAPNDQDRVRPYLNDNLAGSHHAKREPGLFAFNRDDATVRTPLVVCTTSTVTSRAVRTHYGTPALSVTFDPDRTILHLPQDGHGHTLQFAASTAVVDRLGEGLHKRITTMMAVAISSAAVSPAMGRYRIGPTSMLLTFFNIRLGVWIANPRFVTQLEAAGLQDEVDLSYPHTGLGYLFKEFFGIHDLDDPYLYLTDGGHWENTGLVELLRMADITEIVCVDADSGPGDATSSLGKAIAIAPSECDIRIDISLDPLRATPSGSRVPAYSPRTVNIGFFTKGAGSFTAETPVGVLWYAKPGLAKDMPASLLAFHERYPTYPRESTLNQFFDTASFVAYRNFGRYNAGEILLARERLQEALAKLVPIDDPVVFGKSLSDMLCEPSCHWAVAELSRAAHSAAGPNSAENASLVAAYCRAVSISLVQP